MIKTCKCGNKYDAGEGVFLLPVCPDCEKEWDAEIDLKLASEKDRVPDENEILDNLGIRPRHYGCTFENFTARDREEEMALSACKRMSESRRGILALIGNNGTGKTHLACSTAREIGAGKIYKLIEIGMFIREAFKPNSKNSELEQLEKLVRLPFLAIDEADKSKRTDNEMNWVSYLIDERNERYKPTIIIANCHPRAIHKDGSVCEKCFESIMSPDVLDRISQFGLIRYFNGASNRITLRGKD